MSAAEHVLDAIAEGIAQHGQYTYNDKGPAEAVPDYDRYVSELRTDEQILSSLKAILNTGRTRGMYDNAKKFVGAALLDLQDLPDDTWEALMQDPEIEVLF